MIRPIPVFVPLGDRAVLAQFTTESEAAHWGQVVRDNNIEAPAN